MLARHIAGILLGRSSGTHNHSIGSEWCIEEINLCTRRRIGSSESLRKYFIRKHVHSGECFVSDMPFVLFGFYLLIRYTFTALRTRTH